MKYGTVLYRKGADILATLSWALSTSNLAGQWSKPEKQKQHDNYPNAETTLKEASIIMNNLIHDEIKRSVEMTSTLVCSLSSVRLNGKGIVDLDVCAKAVPISTYLNHQKMIAMANRMRILAFSRLRCTRSYELYFYNIM